MPVRPKGIIRNVTTGTTRKFATRPSELVSEKKNSVIGAIKQTILNCRRSKPAIPETDRSPLTNSHVAPALSQKLAPSSILVSHRSMTVSARSRLRLPLMDQPIRCGTCAANSIRYARNTGRLAPTNKV